MPRSPAGSHNLKPFPHQPLPLQMKPPLRLQSPGLSTGIPSNYLAASGSDTSALIRRKVLIPELPSNVLAWKQVALIVLWCRAKISVWKKMSRRLTATAGYCATFGSATSWLTTTWCARDLPDLPVTRLISSIKSSFVRPKRKPKLETGVCGPDAQALTPVLPPPQKLLPAKLRLIPLALSKVISAQVGRFTTCPADLFMTGLSLTLRPENGGFAVNPRLNQPVGAKANGEL